MNSNQLLRHILISGGATINPRTMQLYTGAGYGVAVSKQYETIIALEGDSRDLQGLFNEALVKTRFNALSRKGCYIGAWIDEGKLYLDVTEVVAISNKAVFLGIGRKQLAIWDFKNSQAIDLRKAG